jgi:hypothetical protein
MSDQVLYFNSSVAALGYVIFGSLFLFSVLGLLVEYTSLFGLLPEGDSESPSYDKQLIANKSGFGKFFISFSPS